MIIFAEIVTQSAFWLRFDGKQCLLRRIAFGSYENMN